MSVSCACSLDVRRNELASLFISLILDQSRWVSCLFSQVNHVCCFSVSDVGEALLAPDVRMTSANATHVCTIKSEAACQKGGVHRISDMVLQVRMAAFQALGGFISTFADPSVTGLYFNEEGVLVAGNPEDFPKT